MLRCTVWWLIRAYQLSLSAFVGRACRYEPSCSHYAQEAVLRFGVLRGGWLAVKRISRCGPWGGSGYDPVPENFMENKLDRLSGGTDSLGTKKACPCCQGSKTS